MSSAPVSPYGFVAVRGRGYRPAQVEARAAGICAERDAAWERAARLTVLAREMETEVERLREAVGRLAPQTYDALGESARHLFRLAQEEAAAVRERARQEADERVARAEERARAVRGAAQERADALRAKTEERARARLLAAQTEADAIRVTARTEVKESRGEALAGLRELRRRTEALLTEQEKEQAERWAAVEREEAERADALDAEHARRTALAEAALARAEQEFADAEEAARRGQEEADARAAGLLAAARQHEEHVAQETERILREHGAVWDEVCAHMDHMRTSLTALTGRTVD
ncbi:cellulose-binding protein [Streptomyces longwoodensis]|uniref:cellulose-binding protein n=1 Tax=Streptomyces longwoodensis TaxID=68231 RepID=UPI002E80468C|nr:cellulose-binding protein [Streptomyces longwoodensis]WUC59437.1 cellulose-binding protein [Streptomyces longwoodensis]